MDERKKSILTTAGIDVDSAMERFMGSEALFARLMKKFLEDTNFDKLTDALSAGDMEEALKASHSLKGVCGNLSMTPLFELLSRQVLAFRDGDAETALSLMPEITQIRRQIIQAIQEVFE